ncbi:MAG: AI-2E family transporter [Bacteroidetes bacterium]|nr:AI-2E family transporter [Bacteroidota bacterium]
MMTNTKLLIVLLVLLLAALLAMTVYSIGAIVAIFLVAMLFSFIISPMVDWLESRSMPRALASTIMLLVALGAFIVVVYFLAPLIFDQVLVLQERVSFGEMRKSIPRLEKEVVRYFSFLGVKHLHLTTKIEDFIGGLFDNILNIASSVVGLMIFVVMTLISTFFLLKDGRKLKKGMIEIVPNQFFEMALSILHKIDWSLGAYLRGILMDALVIGLLTTFGMWLLDIPNFILIGLVAMIANLVPYLGPPTAALVASSISVITLGTFGQVPIILATFTLIRLLDDSIVQPLTISQSVKLHPLTIIFAILIGGQLFGILGMLFAVPVAGVAKVVASELYFGLKRYRAVY